MDTHTLEQWRTIIENILQEYASVPYSYGNVEKKVIFDRKNDASPSTAI